MKITKQGKDMTDAFQTKGFCPKCGCEFLYESSDIKSDHERGESWRWIVCPNETCKRNIPLP